MNWFKRNIKNIKTPTSKKKEAPDGMWHKTPKGSIIHIRELKNNSYVSPEDDFHFRIGSKEYFEILFDNNFFSILPRFSSIYIEFFSFIRLYWFGIKFSLLEILFLTISIVEFKVSYFKIS